MTEVALIILVVIVMATGLLYYCLSTINTNILEARLRLKEIRHDLIEIANDFRDIRNNVGRLEAVLIKHLEFEAGK
jgi:hypothetical protein